MLIQACSFAFAIKDMHVLMGEKLSGHPFSERYLLVVELAISALFLPNSHHFEREH